ncbi:hypothetical protein BDZ89DRAFT_1040526 [Hymenopellis radicata]|nr:hypothetical protein BDZ89DRAFT_1040526 [Hymenopellis radicata]
MASNSYCERGQTLKMRAPKVKANTNRVNASAKIQNSCPSSVQTSVEGGKVTECTGRVVCEAGIPESLVISVRRLLVDRARLSVRQQSSSLGFMGGGRAEHRQGNDVDEERPAVEAVVVTVEETKVQEKERRDAEDYSNEKPGFGLWLMSVWNRVFSS